VIPVRDNYSIYYHKLTTDRQGRLFLSYSYWTSDETYQGDFPDRHHNRAVVTSADGGKTWKLLETGDLKTGTN
jgi:Neuraminidase (sialidase)